MELDNTAATTIEDILLQRARVKSMNDSIKESVKALSERLDTKPAQMNRVIALIEKERAKGDVVDGERGILDVVESYLIR